VALGFAESLVAKPPAALGRRWKFASKTESSERENNFLVTQIRQIPITKQLINFCGEISLLSLTKAKQNIVAL